MHFNISQSLKTILLIIAFASVVFAQKPPYGEIFDYYAAEKNFSGAALVASDGTIEYLNGAGFANRQNGTTLTSKSKFRICSVTKTFTAVLIMQLYEQGKIDLNAPVSRYFPEYQGEGKDKITIDNLLTYSSGLDNIDQRDEAVYSSQMSSDQLIAKFFSGKLITEPGKKFSYKNADFIILGKIIEKVTGKPFSVILDENILKPLQMTNTGYLTNGAIVSSLANAYLFDKQTKTFRNDDPFWIDNFYAAGAMYSTVEDLLKFDSAIFDDKILTKKTVDLMLVPRPELASVGYGFWISPVQFGAIKARAADRQGGISGSTATWIHLIDQKKTVIILSNSDATDINEMRAEFVAASLAQPVDLPAFQKTTTTVVKNNLRQIEGTWEIDLRPTPAAEPYLKEFVISDIKDKNFSGIFYGADFTGGQINSSWGEKIYFAFTTGDKNSSYFHSGYIEEGKIHGVSYSSDRKFITPWSGRKKKM